jgi:hypothetical protein
MKDVRLTPSTVAGPTPRPITLSDGQLIATNKDGIQTITLQYLSSMCFMLKGDVDGNGKVDGNDIDMLADVIMGNEESNIRCDVNEDEKVNAGDITVLVNMILRRTSQSLCAPEH